MPEGWHRNAQPSFYVRTDPEGRLPPAEEQRAALEVYDAREKGYAVVARYEDLDAPGALIYHRPGLKEAINNIKEEEDWELLLVADPRCISETETALHEFVHKFSLYNNRVESPECGWDEMLADMRAYRQEIAWHR